MEPCLTQGSRTPGPGPPGDSGVADTYPHPPHPPDLLQVEVTKAYLAKQADEITLQQADVVLVLEQEDGEQSRAGCVVVAGCRRGGPQREGLTAPRGSTPDAGS